MQRKVQDLSQATPADRRDLEAALSGDGPSGSSGSVHSTAVPAPGIALRSLRLCGSFLGLQPAGRPLLEESSNALFPFGRYADARNPICRVLDQFAVDGAVGYRGDEILGGSQRPGTALRQVADDAAYGLVEPNLFHRRVHQADAQSLLRVEALRSQEIAPRLALAMIALCADSPEEAQLIEKAMLIRWAWAAMGINKPLLTLEEAASYQMSEREAAIAARERPRATIGSVDEVATRIVDLKAEFKADEVVVVAIAPAYEIRTRTLKQLASAFGLGK